MSSSKRKLLETLFRYFAAIAGLAFVYVLLDFAFDTRPANVQSSYQFRLRELAVDQPEILRQDNLSILVIKRSADTNARLLQSAGNLQDPDSRRSKQPQFANNALRSNMPEYFVSYAIGTDLGCPLAIDAMQLKETCGKARYDFAGRALAGDNEFRNLAIPDYNFSNDFKILTVRP